jgi:hypothetical protein
VPCVFSGTRWIISQADDLVWFVGTALVGYLAIVLMSVGFPLPLLTTIWILGVDGPHVTGTVTRTYFDKQERRRLGWLLWALIPLLFIGPLAVMVGQGAIFFLLAISGSTITSPNSTSGFVMLWRARIERDGRDEIDRCTCWLRV